MKRKSQPDHRMKSYQVTGNECEQGAKSTEGFHDIKPQFILYQFKEPLLTITTKNQQANKIPGESWSFHSNRILTTKGYFIVKDGLQKEETKGSDKMPHTLKERIFTLKDCNNTKSSSILVNRHSLRHGCNSCVTLQSQKFMTVMEEDYELKTHLRYLQHDPVSDKTHSFTVEFSIFLLFMTVYSVHRETREEKTNTTSEIVLSHRKTRFFYFFFYF